MGQLSERLATHGVKMGKPTLSKIEGGSRQLTAAELTVFAVALNATPNRLLLGDDIEGFIDLTTTMRTSRILARAWANGDELLTSSEPSAQNAKPGALRDYWNRRVEFRRENRPYENTTATEGDKDRLEADGTLPRLVKQFEAARAQGVDDAFLLDYLAMASRYADTQQTLEEDS